MWSGGLPWGRRGRWTSRRSNTATPAGLWARAAGRRWSTADAPASCRGECAWTPTGSSSPSSCRGKKKKRQNNHDKHTSIYAQPAQVYSAANKISHVQSEARTHILKQKLWWNQPPQIELSFNSSNVPSAERNVKFTVVTASQNWIVSVKLLQ